MAPLTNNTFLGIDSFYVKQYFPYALASTAMIAWGVSTIASAKTAGIALAIFGVYTLLNLILSAYMEEPRKHEFDASPSFNNVVLTSLVMLIHIPIVIYDKLCPLNP